MATLVYDALALKRDLSNLFRLPIGDRLALNQFYLEAQALVRRAREAGLALPPVVTDWLAQADARSRDPLLSATQNAALVAWLDALE
ncbi:MAG: hypothetical protein INH41_23290 [Myxococcaceae bacterium]|nr:hypothetical protein [Myxococcaceae bacterium]